MVEYVLIQPVNLRQQRAKLKSESEILRRAAYVFPGFLSSLYLEIY